MVDNNKQTLTNAAGIPVGSNTVSKSVGKQGPLLIEDYTLLEKMAHFNRERVPEGGSDIYRDLRGFSLKFYTEDGNWDMVENNTPIFL